MITMQDKQRAERMGIEAASMIVRRRPQDGREFDVVRIALIALSRTGMDQAAIEVEARRTLRYSEELVLAEFEE